MLDTLLIVYSLMPSIESFLTSSNNPFNCSISHPSSAVLIFSVMLFILMFFRIMSPTSAIFKFEPSTFLYSVMSLIRSAYEIVGFSWLIISMSCFYFYCFDFSRSWSWVRHCRYFFHYELKFERVSSNRMVSLSFLSFYFIFITSRSSMLRTICAARFYFAIMAPSLIELNKWINTFAILMI